VVMRALAKNPANRYQTAHEFAEDLDRVRGGRPVLATPLLPAGEAATQLISRAQHTQVLPPQTEAPGSGRKVWLGVLIGFLIVAVLAGAGYLIYQAVSGNTPTQTTVTVLDVFGKTLEEAKKELEARGLVVADPVLRVDENAVPGTVIDQKPAANTVVPQGSTVTLTVAKAAAKVSVPPLSDMTLAQAQDALASVGLGLGSKTEEPSDTVAEGHVISQDPIAGSKVKKGSLVDVVISSGPKEFTLPDVTCLSFGQAKSKLSALQLNVVNGGTAPLDPLCPEPNKVAAQDPAAGTKVHANDTVTLYTNELTSPSPSP